MPRTYDMRTRGRVAADTHARIIEAAHTLLNQRDGGALALHDVAAAAGVSRATIYNSVGSRRDLLAAVFEDQGRLVGFDRVLAAMRLADPVAAVVGTVRESCRAWSVIPDAIRKTLALAVIDTEVGELVQQYEQYRRAELTAFARRAHRAGVLAPGLGVRNAAATLVLLTSFPVFDQLRLDRGAPAATEHLLRMVRASLGLTLDQE